jgi:hypothetical protein
VTGAARGAPDWSRLLFAGTALGSLVYLYLAFFRPLTLTYDPYAIQDDARQFLLWMPRLSDPALLRGDLLADYWQSVSPPLYRALFAIADRLGLAPTVFARLLPVPLLLFCAWSAWRLASALTASPRAAFVAAGFAMGFVLHEDSIFTATPRGFASPLLLLFFHGLVAERWRPMLVALVLLGALYPAPAIVGATMLALSRVRSLVPVRIDLSRRSVLLTGGIGLAVIAAMLPFAMQTQPWDPALTLAEARDMPNMMDPLGRSSIVDAAGRIGWACSPRMGFVPSLFPCDGSVPLAMVWNLLLLTPLLVLAGRHVLGHGRREQRLYVVALAATAIWFTIAAALAFRLHLPSRYSQRVLGVLEWLAIGQVIGNWLESRLAARRASMASSAAARFIAVLLAVSFAIPVPGTKRPADYALIDRIAALPVGSRIGGVSEQLDFIPALTGRAVLASPEHAIPYQLGYYRQIAARLQASLLAVSTPDRQVFRRAMRAYPADYLLIEREMLTSGTIPGRYAQIVPAASRAAAGRLKAEPSLAARAPRDCIAYSSRQFVLIESACLAKDLRLLEMPT